ncbi:tRNA synthetase class II (D K and N) [Hymenobacter roseosalivarius DSM 11622]|uniref:tRNA synthetase class II (D K and N) n=1 Tax=Hymenobacter roseosalivarius DSM 11622 TaxID=645990 RepID=A0A1W1VP46_9BACT|nr:amino acid--tRNA ligase-related protein [Hymenobacter roseosalivarius]SMB95128.1 tRNA synthetase class II (D K and N) [Hymenobacter roseosalivarius DSM 11622]
MQDNLTLAPQAAAFAATRNVNLSTDPKRMAIIKVWDAMFRGARKYVESEGFMAVHNMPHIVGVTGACENTDTLFTIDWYDGKKMFLPQSNQLYIEMLTQKVESGRVYGEIQSFRKEMKADSRRLAQFSLFEIEHIGDLDELLGHLSGIVASASRQVAQDCEKELALFGRNAADLSSLTFKRMTYTDAVEVLKGEGFPELQWGDDLEAPHEGRLTELMGPMFVTHYPADIKFFNMRNNDEDPRVVNSSDLLLPLAGESAGSAEREFDAAKLRHKLETSSMLEGLIRQGMKLSDFDWYLDFHKENEVKLHSGAGVGMARVAQFILGQEDIRECVPFLINRDNVI